MLGLYLAFVCAVVVFLAVSPSWRHAGVVLDEVTTHRGLQVGDRVTIGRGRTVWVIDSFDDERGLAHLNPTDGYTGTTVIIERLWAVAA